VVHLAAQAGVRYSLMNPHAYIDSNISGFMNILEGCRHNGVRHLVYASSSSVYGANTRDALFRPPQCGPSRLPVCRHQEGQRAHGPHLCQPLQNPLHRPAVLHRLRSLGPPGHGLFLFTKAILDGQTHRCLQRREDAPRLHLYRRHRRGHGPGHRQGRGRANPAWSGDAPDPGTSYAPYRIYNIGNNNPVELLRFIEVLEEKIGRKAIKNLLPLQPGDVPATSADVDDLMHDVGFAPDTSIEQGIDRFVDWYRTYYRC
jgi:UDP-glucuronate 4-epimerase